MINFATSLFLVDGITEIRSFKAKFQKEYGATPDFRLVGCNGKDVSAKGYANKAVPIISMAICKHYESIVCVLDKEQRKTNCIKFSEDIEKEIKKKLLASACLSLEYIESLVHVSVSDIMFENWIIADIDGIKIRDSLIQDDATQYYFDGKSGSTVLQRIMLTKYKKTQHAELFFKAVDFIRAKKFSPSFACFCSLIGV